MRDEVGGKDMLIRRSSISTSLLCARMHAVYEEILCYAGTACSVAPVTRVASRVLERVAKDMRKARTRKLPTHRCIMAHSAVAREWSNSGARKSA
jgi:hypothetical protein